LLSELGVLGALDARNILAFSHAGQIVTDDSAKDAEKYAPSGGFENRPPGLGALAPLRLCSPRQARGLSLSKAGHAWREKFWLARHQPGGGEIFVGESADIVAGVFQRGDEEIMRAVARFR
jgi:hypothetical protein